LQILDLMIEALLFILPAYCANAVPVLAGGGLPLDFGRNFVDGNPILGKNKTFRGFLAGLIVGTIVGWTEILLNYPLRFGFQLGFMLALGALVGDLAGAFTKRRLGLAPGELLPIVDQIDFVVGAVALSLPISLQFMTWQLTAAIFILTPPIHMLTNFAAYKLGLKSNPL
jgi:CDP-2,3-bis-(O-geranylgeranyl)-sn-glycerol synthase